MLVERDPTARAPGQYTRSIVHRLRLRTLLMLGALAVETTLVGRRFGWQNPRFLGAEVALLVGIFVISRYLLPLVDRHHRGALGEEHVGRLLDDLGEGGWHTIHDVSLGRGNVDHIAVGPGGIFTVETKSHPGPIHVARLHGSTLGQAQAARRVVERATGEHVEPLLVYSRAWVDRPLHRRRGVRVVPARMLRGYLRRQPQRLDGERVDHALRALAEAARAQRRRRWS
ncbi:MAG TPA: nuclease-related domain-containing protein [Solirubrobacteraceae bacterium]|nr:nuclease-related domain-containing protein [Solirubrobacteraceae bacterium]